MSPSAINSNETQASGEKPGVVWGEQKPAPRRSGLSEALHRALVGVMKAMPRSVVRLAASPYIAGEDSAQAWRLADDLWRTKQLHSTLDVLGEHVQSQADIDDYFSQFKQLVTELEGRKHANISIKLSALGQAQDEDACFQRTRELVAQARDVGTFVRFDMEDATTVSSTLGIYRRVRKEFDNCGVVLQSRLYRTREDIESLRELRPNVRLCIGIYPENPSIALQSKTEMKRHLLELLNVLWDNGQHVAIATHEEWVIRKALELADKKNKPSHEIEVQMLLGVPRNALQKELVQRGVRVRLYVPYGRRWYAYSMRRLENNPDMLRMVAGNVLGGLFRAR